MDQEVQKREILIIHFWEYRDIGDILKKQCDKNTIRG